MLGHNAFELAVLRFELATGALWAGLRLADIHAAKLTFPGVKSVLADIMLAAHISGLDAAFLLLEDADDLLLAESSLHAFLLLECQRIHALFWHTFPGLRQRHFSENLTLPSIREGVRHGDIQDTNVFLFQDDLIFVDFDDVHWGYPLMDYIQALAMYFTLDRLHHEANEALIESILPLAREQMSGITTRDIKYLLARVLLGPIQGGDWLPHRKKLIEWLDNLEAFVNK